MSLLRHIRQCNRFAPDRFLPLNHEGARVGLVRRDNAEHLRQFPTLFRVGQDDVTLAAAGGFERVSALVDEAVETLVAGGIMPKWRNEFFAIAPAGARRRISGSIAARCRSSARAPTACI